MEQCQFPPNETLALFFLPACKSSVCKWAVAMTVLPKKDTAMHPHAFCCHTVKYFAFLRKSLYAEASLFCDTEELFPYPSYFLLLAGFPCSKQETCIHSHSRPSFSPIKNQEQPFHGLPRALDEQKQLEISSTADSLRQKGDIWGSFERQWHSKGVAALCLESRWTQQQD